MDYHELSKMKVTDLRELAKEKTELTGVSGLSKEQLIDTLADAMGIEKPHKIALIQGKSELKKQLRQCKADRLEALAARDRDKLLKSRQELKKIRRKLQHAAKEALRRA